MITKVIDNIINEVIENGFNDKEMIGIIRNAISNELSKYELNEKEKSPVLYDSTNNDIISKFFISKITCGFSDRSIKYYKSVLCNVFFKINKNIKDIKTDDIRAYLAYRKISGLNSTSLDNERRVISSFFTFAHDEGLIDNNPSKRVEKIRQRKQQKKPFTEEEMEMLRVALKTKRDKAIIEFLYSTGCRVSEAVNVNINDIDFENREVIVLGKGNKERIVFLSFRCLSCLHEYLKTRTDRNPALFVSSIGDHDRINISRIEVIIREAGKKCGIVNAHPHRIRRTAATIALQRGMPIEQVSKMLGHEDINTTIIYANSTMEQVKISHDKYLN